MAGPVLITNPVQVLLDSATLDISGSEPSLYPLGKTRLNQTDRIPPKASRPAQYLQASGYADPEHLLDIHSVGTADRLFAQALTVLEPKTGAYAVARYEEAFNWADVFSYLRTLSKAQQFQWETREFYVVEFRSKLMSVIDRELLFKLDKESHREATESGGLLKYWFGVPDLDRRNLATCLWRNKDDAINGGKGMWHKQARSIISQMYEEIDVKGLRLTVEQGAKSWSFQPFNFH